MSGGLDSYHPYKSARGAGNEEKFLYLMGNRRRRKKGEKCDVSKIIPKNLKFFHADIQNHKFSANYKKSFHNFRGHLPDPVKTSYLYSHQPPSQLLQQTYIRPKPW